MTYQFKKDDEGLTRDGRKYRVVADNLRNNWSIVAVITNEDGIEFSIQASASGQESGFRNHLHLMPPVQVREFWLVMFTSGKVEYTEYEPRPKDDLIQWGPSDHTGKSFSHKWVVAITGPHKVEFTPGTGLEGGQ